MSVEVAVAAAVEKQELVEAETESGAVEDVGYQTKDESVAAQTKDVTQMGH
jgi:hypothetical protein